jgi:hypothetical protein
MLILGFFEVSQRISEMSGHSIGAIVLDIRTPDSPMSSEAREAGTARPTKKPDSTCHVSPYIILFVASLISHEKEGSDNELPGVTTMGMDHRWGQRQSTDVTVHVVARSGMTGIARVVNVSLTGAYLETSVPLRLHSLVYLRPSAQNHARISGNRVAANVVRLDELGVGLEWRESLTKRAHVDALLAMLGKRERVDCVSVVGVEWTGATDWISHSAEHRS